MIEKCVMWGTGVDADILFKELEEDMQYCNQEIVACFDNNSNRQGKVFHGLKIESASNIFNHEFDYVVIASRDYEHEIKTQLVNDYDIADNKILNFKQFLSKLNIAYQYNRNVAENILNENRISNRKIVVYTAISGEYDWLKDPEFLSDDITYVCFTDNKNIHSDIWNIEYIGSGQLKDTALGIRQYKLLPHRYFSEFESSIWVDGNLQIKGDLREIIDQYGRGSDLICCPHQFRKCIYDEAAAIIELKKAPKDLVIKQVGLYQKEGYPCNAGLIVGSFLIRNHHDELLNKTMEEWFQQVKKYTRRDQLSLPYTLKKNNCRYDLCNMDVNNNKWIIGQKHKCFV